MAQQTINIGSAPNDGTGDTLRAAYDKANDNFTELYDADTAQVADIAALDGRVAALEAVVQPYFLAVALSDEATAITAGAGKVVTYADCDFELSEVFIGLSGQSSSGAVRVDVNKAGSTIFSTRPAIEATEDTSLTGTAAVLSTTSFSKGDKISFDIDDAGTDAKGLKVFMIGTIAS
ncbi:MAG: hypothetical protein EOR12_27100 [Mesorhizobium sp.]|uniref:hypothetical protein n=1 Tax=Mesorhizobium sp. TaxID=1871066 RepID=UPI000FE9FF82|nr:hypothetical protein [Mesorhizobium sp.]RWP84901.1 MAG: hypothetical protein EOR12_27100 [Mesorhizobium sp.]